MPFRDFNVPYEECKVLLRAKQINHLVDCETRIAKTRAHTSWNGIESSTVNDIAYHLE